MTVSRIHFSEGRRSFLATGAVVLCGIMLAACAFLGYRLVRQHSYMQRGILYEALPALPLPGDSWYGVNVSLEQYSAEHLPAVLSMVREAGFTWVRQRFPWAEIEPQAGQYEWEGWDQLVAETRRQGLRIIAVLDTSPAWARAAQDRDNRNAPPQFATTYALFVRAFVQRYQSQIGCYQVWDQPNIFPYWGARAVDPAAYVRLLKLATAEIRRVDANAIVLSAALAPNTEGGGRNMSDVLFLRGMYQAGAKGHFDVLAAKAYGFWSGPEDRRVDPQVLNFSRLILLREEMVRQGDASVPIWAVEFGWNALPPDWKGQPPPWGTDDVARQVDRTQRAVRRAREEWGWLGMLCAAHLQPAVPAEDAQWGFALLGPDSNPTAFYQAWQEVIAMPVVRVKLDNTSYFLRLAWLVAMNVLALGLLVFLWPRSAWGAWLQRWQAAYLSASEWLQWTVLGLLLFLFYCIPWALPALVALALAGLLISLRLDIGLAYLVFSVPFFLYPKAILGKAFSMVEILTLICFAAWLWANLRSVLKDKSISSHVILSKAKDLGVRGTKTILCSLTFLDKAVVAFVLLAAFSLLVSTNLGVSIREFRVIIVEPALFYLLLRQVQLSEKQLLRLADALVLAGVTVSVVGLYQYFGRGDVIVTEGVRRVHAVYASPNNLSLLLGRIVPLCIAALLVAGPPRRRAYGLALLPLLLCLFLTYSRGGWLLSLPAGLLAVGLLRGQRTVLIMITVIVITVVALLPLLGTQRFTSLLDLEQGTTFRRLRLWQAAVNMIRDHPLTGVGLDNFLYQYPNYMLSDAWQEPDLSHPHNIVLDYWTRLGIAGVVILVWLQAAFFALALWLYRRLSDGDARAIILGFIASMVAMVAHGLIDNSYFLVDLAFIFFLSLGWQRAMQRELLCQETVHHDKRVSRVSEE